MRAQSIILLVFCACLCASARAQSEIKREERGIKSEEVESDIKSVVSKISAVQTVSYVQGMHVVVHNGAFDVAEIKEQSGNDKVVISYCKTDIEEEVDINSVSMSEDTCADNKTNIPILVWEYNPRDFMYDVSVFSMNERWAIEASGKSMSLKCSDVPNTVALAARDSSSSGTWYANDEVIHTLSGMSAVSPVPKDRIVNSQDCAEIGSFWLFGENLEEDLTSSQDNAYVQVIDNLLKKAGPTKWQFVAEQGISKLGGGASMIGGLPSQRP